MVTRSAPQPRTKPYIWAGWLAPLMVTDANCHWAVWFKAHFSYEKISDFKASKWQAEHGALVVETRQTLIDDDYAVFTENQNMLKLESNGIILSGKPDIIAVRGDQVLVIDCKTGSPRVAHRVQLLLYIVMLPCARPHLKGYTINGMLQYKDDYVMMPASEADSSFRSRLRSLIHVVGGEAPPARQPSPSECRFCSISHDDCSDRADEAGDQAITDHDLF